MGIEFIVSGVLSLILIILWVWNDKSRENINIQPSLKSILLFWKEEAGIKRLIAILELYCLYLIVTGIVFILVGFDPNNIVEFIVSLVFFAMPALVYRAIRYIRGKS